MTSNNQTFNRKSIKSTSLISKKSVRSKKDQFQRRRLGNLMPIINTNEEEKVLLGKIINEMKKENDVLRNFSLFDIGKMRRNNVLFTLLTRIQGFKDFLIRNNIENEKKHIKKLVEKSDFLILDKENVIHQQGDKGIFLYGILKGRVGLYSSSINKVNSHLTHTKKCLFFKKFLSQGTFFGDWELLSGKAYSNYAVAEERVELLIVSVSDYNNSVMKVIKKNMIEYKLQLIEKEQVFRRYLNKSIETFFTSFRVVSCGLNERIYNENEDSFKFYFILNGQFTVEKNVVFSSNSDFFRGKNESEVDNYLKHSIDCVQLLILEKFEFSGFESLFNTDTSQEEEGNEVGLIKKMDFQKGKGIKYEYSLRSKSKSGLIIEIDPMTLERNVYKDLLMKIKGQSQKRRLILKRRYEKYVELKSNLRLKYVSFTKNPAENEEKKKEFEKMVEFSYKNLAFQREIQKYMSSNVFNDYKCLDIKEKDKSDQENQTNQKEKVRKSKKFLLFMKKIAEKTKSDKEKMMKNKEETSILSTCLNTSRRISSLNLNSIHHTKNHSHNPVFTMKNEVKKKEKSSFVLKLTLKEDLKKWEKIGNSETAQQSQRTISQSENKTERNHSFKDRNVEFSSGKFSIPLVSKVKNHYPY